MSRRANPKLVGGFVLAAIGLAVAAALVFGSFTLFEPTHKFVVFFQGSVDGLAQGSQVLFRGVPVGKVVDVGIRYDPRDSSFAIPVIIEIRPAVIAKYSPPATLSAEGLKRLIDEGLRARLETSSLVTGQQVVQLNFFPGSPVELAQTDLPYYQLPTLPSPTQQLMSSIDTAAQDLPTLITKATALVDRGQRLLSPENENAVHSLLESAASAMKKLDAAATNLDPLLVAAENTVASAGQLAKHLDGVVQDNRPPAFARAGSGGGALTPPRRAELLPVPAHDRGRRFQPNADGAALVDEGISAGNPPDDILRGQYRRHLATGEMVVVTQPDRLARSPYARYTRERTVGPLDLRGIADYEDFRVLREAQILCHRDAATAARLDP